LSVFILGRDELYTHLRTLLFFNAIIEINRKGYGACARG